MLEVEHERHFGRFENLDGFSFHAIVRFLTLPKDGPKYFLDMGIDSKRNRVSFLITEQGDVAFSMRDHAGRSYEIGITSSYADILNKWIYLVCEFGSAEDRFIMQTSVNGHDMDLREKDQKIDIRLPLKNMHLGTDISHMHFGSFDVAEKFMYARTLKFRERYQCLAYVAGKYHGLEAIPKYLSFDGTKFMILSDNGDFVQQDVEFRPKLSIES